MGKQHDSFALNGHIIKHHTHSYTPALLLGRFSTLSIMRVENTAQSSVIFSSENIASVAECAFVLCKIILVFTFVHVSLCELFLFSPVKALINLTEHFDV